MPRKPSPRRLSGVGKSMFNGLRGSVKLLDSGGVLLSSSENRRSSAGAVRRDSNDADSIERKSSFGAVLLAAGGARPQRSGRRTSSMTLGSSSKKAQKDKEAEEDESSSRSSSLEAEIHKLQLEVERVKPILQAAIDERLVEDDIILKHQAQHLRRAAARLRLLLVVVSYAPPDSRVRGRVGVVPRSLVRPRAHTPLHDSVRLLVSRRERRHADRRKASTAQRRLHLHKAVLTRIKINVECSPRDPLLTGTRLESA